MPPTESPQVLISVLLVVRNEAGCVAECIESVLDQTFPAEDYELIVVDGMSTDGTRERIREIQDRYPDRSIRVLDNPRGILSTGWNIGILAAQGRYVIRPDAHARIARGFLAENWRAMQAHPECAAVGGVIETIGRGVVGGTIAAALSSRFGVGGSRFRIGGRAGPADTAVFGLYRREVLLAAGGFDESLRRNQDVACHSRIKSAGGTFFFDPAIQSTYYCRATIPAVARQMYLNGHWLPLLSKHRISRCFSLRYFVPLVFVLVLLSLAMTGLVYPLAHWTLVGLLGLYFIAAAGASVRTSLSARQRILFPIVTFVMHISYGLGWLTGLLRLPFYRPASTRLSGLCQTGILPSEAVRSMNSAYRGDSTARS